MTHRNAVLASSFVLLVALTAQNLQACTSMLVTKGASADGSVMITYTADSAGYYPILEVWHAAYHPEGAVIEIPATANRPVGFIKQVPRTNHVIGVVRNQFVNDPGEYWVKQGFINEHQLAITESTFTGRRELVNPQGLINYPMLITLALQRAATAREAIDVMVELVEEYGFNSTGESISIADTEEAWVFEIIGTGPKLPPLRRFERADNAGEVTREISRAISEYLPNMPLGIGFGVGTTDGRRITLSFNQDTPQETVDSVAQMVRDLPNVGEVFTVWTPFPPTGVSQQEYRNYLLTTQNTTDDQAQALALFREGERVYISGNFHEAKPLLERFVEQRPHDQRLEHVLFYLGMIAWNESRLWSNRLEEAKFYFEQSVRMFPNGVRYQESRDALNQIIYGGGVVWVARKVPDGHISAHANMARIGEIPDVPCRDSFFYSDNIKSFAIARGFYDPNSGEPFRFNYAYGAIDAFTKRVCETRTWSIFRRAAPSQYFSSDYHRDVPGAEPYPWSIKPDNKLTLADVFALKRDHYEGTEFDMTQGIDAGPHGLPRRWRPLVWTVEGEGGDRGETAETPYRYAWERPISTQQTGFSVVTQSRSWLPNAVGGVAWYGVDDTYTTCYFPLYAGITAVPPSFAAGSIERFSWDSAWWIFNLVANYANLKFNRIVPDIKEVQHELESWFMTMQSPFEQAIVKTMETDPELAIRHLTNYSVSQGELVVTRWQQLAIDIFTKYNDGFIRQDEGHPYPAAGDPYPDEWLRRVLQERPYQFKLPRSE